MRHAVVRLLVPDGADDGGLLVAELARGDAGHAAQRRLRAVGRHHQLRRQDAAIVQRHARRIAREVERGDDVRGEVLGSLGRSPRSVFVFPVEVRGRLVAVLYGDRGERAVSQRRLSDLILFCQDLGQAFAELIVLRKQRRFSDDDRPPETSGVLGLDGSLRRTPETLDRAPPPAALGDLYRLSLDDILDYLVELGGRLHPDRNPHVAGALQAALGTTHISAAMQRRMFRALPSMMTRAVRPMIADSSCGGLLLIGSSRARTSRWPPGWPMRTL